MSAIGHLFLAAEEFKWQLSAWCLLSTHGAWHYLLSEDSDPAANLLK